MFGSPERFGAFRPAGDFLSVGRALSQHFLPLVAEGRIVVKPWISEIQDRNVRFLDESSEEFDAIIFGFAQSYVTAQDEAEGERANN